MQNEIIAGAKTSFLHGDQWAYTAGIVAIVLGAVLVFFLFPRREDEERLLARYREEDNAAGPDNEATAAGETNDSQGRPVTLSQAQ